MSQIKIQELLPLLRKGWVAMDINGEWWWYKNEPKPYFDSWNDMVEEGGESSSLDAFDIAPFEGNWKNSVMECGK